MMTHEISHAALSGALFLCQKEIKKCVKVRREKCSVTDNWEGKAT